jgi:hypothetical protein
MLKSFVLVLLVLLTAVVSGHAQDNRLVEHTVRTTTDFQLTGDGSRDEWRKADWIVLTQRKGAVSYPSTLKLLHSEKGIYCLFRCEDKKITATFTEDFANLWTEDVVEIFFWTDESAPLYFEYELSPLNYELPILIPNFKGDFLGWRPWQYEGERKTRHATHIENDASGNPTAWTAEIFIPYILLKPLMNVPPKPGQPWRMNAYRVDHDNGHTSWSWVPVLTNFHDYERFGTLKFE